MTPWRIWLEVHGITSFNAVALFVRGMVCYLKHIRIHYQEKQLLLTHWTDNLVLVYYGIESSKYNHRGDVTYSRQILVPHVCFEFVMECSFAYLFAGIDVLFVYNVSWTNNTCWKLYIYSRANALIGTCIIYFVKVGLTLYMKVCKYAPHFDLNFEHSQITQCNKI